MTNKPTILLPGKYSESDVDELRNNSKIWKEIDLYPGQLEELLEIKYPEPGERETQKEVFIENQTKKGSGAWIYYPWSGVLVHTVGPEDLYNLRTNRNQNIITKSEQEMMKQSVIGVAGMSVGAGIAIGSVYAGMANTIKIADFDSLETANLNRIRESIQNIGVSKAELTSRNIYELNPYNEVITFSEGITESNIDKFFDDPKLSVIVDEIDDFKIKVLLRVKAKQFKVPLLMFTSLGDNILIDIERYDLPNQPEIFNGAIGNTADEILTSKNISKEDIQRYAVQVVGAEYVSTRALASLPEIGKSLVGRPQLYSTIAVDGGLAVYIIRQIILKKDVKSGRYFVKFGDLINLDTDDFGGSARENILNKLMANKNGKKD